MFETECRETGEKLTNSPEVIEDLRLRLHSKLDAPKINFISDDKRRHEVIFSVDGENKVSLRIFSAVGNVRNERWQLDKVMSYLEAGFLAEHGKDLHKRWIENSKPKPMTEDQIEQLRRWGFPTTIDETIKVLPKLCGLSDEMIEGLEAPKVF